ncbi:MAG: hypothetical protein M1504_02250 [Candidatus Marsarchaeota archaeon]|nr:hypothetical protein [Candidatus Marsarchaeota archaeon]
MKESKKKKNNMPSYRLLGFVTSFVFIYNAVLGFVTVNTIPFIAYRSLFVGMVSVDFILIFSLWGTAKLQRFA